MTQHPQHGISHRDLDSHSRQSRSHAQALQNMLVHAEGSATEQPLEGAPRPAPHKEPRKPCQHESPGAGKELLHLVGLLQSNPRKHLQDQFQPQSQQCQHPRRGHGAWSVICLLGLQSNLGKLLLQQSQCHSQSRRGQRDRAKPQRCACSSRGCCSRAEPTTPN